MISNPLKKSVTMDSRLRGNDRISEIPWKWSFPRRRESMVTTEFGVIERAVRHHIPPHPPTPLLLTAHTYATQEKEGGADPLAPGKRQYRGEVSR